MKKILLALTFNLLFMLVLSAQHTNYDQCVANCTDTYFNNVDKATDDYKNACWNAAWSALANIVNEWITFGIDKNADDSAYYEPEYYDPFWEVIDAEQEYEEDLGSASMNYAICMESCD